MSCETCGRPAENGTPTHWLGCEAVAGRSLLGPLVQGLTLAPPPSGECEHDECSEPKWSSGPRTKYCETHKDPKSREK